MINFYFIVLMAVFVLLWPLRQFKFLSALTLVAFLCLVSFCGLRWGGFLQYRQYLANNAREVDIKNSLVELGSPQKVIAKMEQHLTQNPDSAKGWYLLGKLYLSQGNYGKAQRAFLKASIIEPNDNKIILNLAQSELLLRNYNVADKLLAKLVEQQPNDGEVISLQAMSYYQQKRYQLAISKWRRLLVMLPQDSHEAKLITKAITQTQQKISIDS